MWTELVLYINRLYKKYVLSNPDICMPTRNKGAAGIKSGTRNEFEIMIVTTASRNERPSSQRKPLSVTYGIGIRTWLQPNLFYLVTVTYQMEARLITSSLARGPEGKDDFLTSRQLETKTSDFLRRRTWRIRNRRSKRMSITPDLPRRTLRNSTGVTNWQWCVPLSDTIGAYSWGELWNARCTGCGWRCDYFVVSALAPLLKEVDIRSDNAGSDRCPVKSRVKP